MNQTDKGPEENGELCAKLKFIYHVNGYLTHRKRRSGSFHDVDITSGCLTLIAERQCNRTSQSECM